MVIGFDEFLVGLLVLMLCRFPYRFASSIFFQKKI